MLSICNRRFLIGLLYLQAVNGISTGGKVTCPSECACDENFIRVNCSGITYGELLLVNEGSNGDCPIPTSTEHLDLSNAKIAKLPKVLLGCLHDLSYLSLNSNNIRDVDNTRFCQENNLQYLFLQRNRIVALGPNAFRGCVNLKTLFLSNNDLLVSTLPAALTNLPNLYTLDLGYNTLVNSTVLPLNLTQFTKLHNLYLQNVGLTAISSAFFDDVVSEKISELDLSFNPIAEMQAGAFRKFISLQVLDLSYSELSLNSTGNVLEDLRSSSIRQLDLQYVFPHADNANDWDELFLPLINTSLRVLHFEGNKGAFAGAMSKNFLSPLLALEELYLDDCGLLVIHPRAVHRLHHLKVLSLRKNHVTCSTSCKFIEILGGQSRLEKLDLSDNGLQSADLGADHRRLKELNLSRNPLQNLDKSMFRGMDKLEILDLSETLIDEVPEGCFEHARKLKFLRLNNCGDLKAIRKNAFLGAHHIEVLEIKQGALTSIHPTGFANLQNIRSISLSHNDLVANDVCSALIYMLSKRLETLDLSYNNIEAFPSSFITIHGGTLRELLLQHNRIYNLGNFDCPALRVLDVSHNNLCTLPVNALKKSPNMTSLKIDENFITCTCSNYELFEFFHDFPLALSVKVPPSCFTEDRLKNTFTFNEMQPLRRCEEDFYRLEVMVKAIVGALLVGIGCVTACLVAGCTNSRKLPRAERSATHDLETAAVTSVAEPEPPVDGDNTAKTTSEDDQLAREPLNQAAVSTPIAAGDFMKGKLHRFVRSLVNSVPVSFRRKSVGDGADPSPLVEYQETDLSNGPL